MFVILDDRPNTFQGTAASDSIFGQGGNDTFYGGGGGDFLWGEEGNDTLGGEAGDDWLNGGAGTYASAGSDVIDGGTGVDMVTYSNFDAVRGVNVNLATGRASTAFGTDRLIGIENAWGTSFGDTITGNAVANRLYGDDGKDQLVGGRGHDSLSGDDGNDQLRGDEGDDWLFGWVGNDQLLGGAGADSFIFDDGESLAGASRDIITDFTGNDRLSLFLIDANGATSQDDAFRFIGNRSLGGASQLAARSMDGGLLLQGSTDADASAEFELFLSGVRSVAVADMFL